MSGWCHGDGSVNLRLKVPRGSLELTYYLLGFMFLLTSVLIFVPFLNAAKNWHNFQAGRPGPTMNSTNTESCAGGNVQSVHSSAVVKPSGMNI